MVKCANVYIVCEVCGTSFRVSPSRLGRKKYCRKECAYIGQGRNRAVWSKGKTKATDPRIKKYAEARSRFYEEQPSPYQGANHPMYGKKHTEETRAKMRVTRARQVVTPQMLAALEGGRQSKGRTKDNDAGVARRAAMLSKKYKGRKNPDHAKRMRRYYEQNPEKHPNRILAKRGHETNLERTMRIALTTAGIIFEVQYAIGRWFVDFAILDKQIAIEVDGAYWHDQERDEARDVNIRAYGWQVIRFSEDRVLHHLADCISQIRLLLASA